MNENDIQKELDKVIEEAKIRVNIDVTSKFNRPIKILQIDPTDVCQAACPQCARETDKEFYRDNKRHLKLGTLLTLINHDEIMSLDKMFMCGNYGDPAASHNTLEIFRHFRETNPQITLGMNSNGGLQSTFWWYELAKILNQPTDYVVFSIDGLETTNSDYRVNVKWDKVMQNAEAFISAGGNAHWDMLAFKHNEHQIEDCKKLAKEMGFKWFRLKVTNRPLVKKLEYPVNFSRPEVVYGDIKCRALENQSAYVDSRGKLYPCCWLATPMTSEKINFDEIQASWDTDSPHPTCKSTCASCENQSNFTNQWLYEIEL